MNVNMPSKLSEMWEALGGFWVRLGVPSFAKTGALQFNLVMERYHMFPNNLFFYMCLFFVIKIDYPISFHISHWLATCCPWIQQFRWFLRPYFSTCQVRVSTASAGCQWALPDRNHIECQTLERQTDRQMECQSICQIECQKGCQIECWKIRYIDRIW